MTAPTLLSDAELRWALAGPDGVPATCDDPRLAVWHAAGWIDVRGQVWRWNVRIPSQLTPAQREHIREDMAHVRRSDV